MTLFDYFLPSAGQIINLFAVLAILAVFAVLGGAALYLELQNPGAMTDAQNGFSGV